MTVRSRGRARQPQRLRRRPRSPPRAVLPAVSSSPSFLPLLFLLCGGAAAYCYRDLLGAVSASVSGSVSSVSAIVSAVSGPISEPASAVPASDLRGSAAVVRRFGGAPVVTLPEFFPRGLAEAWRRTFEREWRAGTFQLATNNDGGGRERGAGGNAKYRSHERAAARRDVANGMRRRGLFSYAKRELPPDHAVLAEIAEYMLRNDTRHRIAVALNTSAGLDVSGDRLDARELSDLFATSFGVGDFLSMHADGFSGTYAFVASLAAGGAWRPEYGGGLEMFCRDTRKWCGSLAPTFNSLVVFKTRQPVGPPHRVAAVREEAAAQGWRRHGFTGWYRDVEDVMTEAEMKERDAMRGRN